MRKTVRVNTFKLLVELEQKRQKSELANTPWTPNFNKYSTQTCIQLFKALNQINDQKLFEVLSTHWAYEYTNNPLESKNYHLTFKDTLPEETYAILAQNNIEKTKLVINQVDDKEPLKKLYKRDEPNVSWLSRRKNCHSIYRWV